MRHRNWFRAHGRRAAAVVLTATAAGAAGAGPFEVDRAARPAPDTRPSAATPSPHEPDGTPDDVAAAARKLLAEIQKQQDLGEPMTPTVVVLKLDASRRLAAAEQDLARRGRDLPGQRAALAAHVERVRQTREFVARQSRHPDAGNPVTDALLDLELAEAKQALAAATGRRRVDPATAPATRPAAFLETPGHAR